MFELKYLNLWIDRFLVPIDDPTSRLFHLNIIFSLVFIFVWILVKNQTSKAQKYSIRNLRRLSKKLILNKKYWWNSSTKTDYKLYFLNSILKVLIFIPFLDFTFGFSVFIVKFLRNSFSHFQSLPTSAFNLFLFTLFFFIIDDLIRFLHHLLMHKIPFLWKFHSVHHSATTLTPITLYRTHPVESALATLRNSFSLGFVTALFVFIFGTQLNLTTILGINFFGFMFNLMGSNLRHSQIPVSFGFLEKIFISPKQHQIHHSNNPEHFEKNFGVSLSVWDMLNNSWKSSHDVKKIRFGLEKMIV